LAVNNAINPLAMVVLPEPLVGAAMRKLGFMGTKIHTFCFFWCVSSNFFTLCSLLFTLFCNFATEKWQSGGRCHHDERESGESPELFLQL
jgi:hypothetical protein